MHPSRHINQQHHQLPTPSTALSPPKKNNYQYQSNQTNTIPTSSNQRRCTFIYLPPATSIKTNQHQQHQPATRTTTPSINNENQPSPNITPTTINHQLTTRPTRNNNTQQPTDTIHTTTYQQPMTSNHQYPTNHKNQLLASITIDDFTSPTLTYYPAICITTKATMPAYTNPAITRFNTRHHCLPILSTYHHSPITSITHPQLASPDIPSILIMQ
jgi:hypothetical protein